MEPRTEPLRPYTLNVIQFVGFLSGLIFGSFLNVCISRIPKGESIIHPRSRCPQCGASIRWYDNIPLLSWLSLRGRCRDCRQSISWQYPLVELAVGLWFMLVAIQIHSAPSSVIYLIELLSLVILGFLLIGLVVIDWQTFTLPDAFTLTGIFIGFILTFIRATYLAPRQYDLLLHGHNPLTSVGGAIDNGNVVLTGPEHLVLGRLFAITLAACILLFIRFAYKTLRHREGLGFGDIKLIAMIAAFLGFWPAILALFLGVILCAFYAITLLARSRATATTRLPLGTFLCIGGIVSSLWGQPILAAYLHWAGL